MHPDLTSALARLRTRELLRPAEFRDTARAWHPYLESRDVLRRARRFLGAALLDLGVHLLATT
jgi:hypothetical protein